MQQAYGNLPYPTDNVNQGTLRNGLPGSNDVYPQLALNNVVNQQTAAYIVGLLRSIAQNKLQNSPGHTFTYNELSANYFNNQAFVTWCQRAVDFVEYLVIVQREDFNNAVAKACDQMFKYAVAINFVQYMALSSTLQGQAAVEVNETVTRFNSLIQDLQAFQQRGRTPQPMMGQPYAQPQPMMAQPYGAPNGNMLPPINMQPQGNPYVHQYNAPQQMNMAPAGYQPQQFQGHATVDTTTRRESGRYDDIIAPKDSWTAGKQTIPPLTPPNAQPVVTQQPSVNPTAPIVDIGKSHVNRTDSQVIPSTLEEIIMDPKAYVPEGVTYDPEKPYDTFYNPGGIVIAPAHKSGWNVTKGDRQKYSYAYDSDKFIAFHVKWPDGVVDEKIVEWTDDMEYLKHEIDDTLRKRYSKQNGKVNLNTSVIIDIDGGAKDIDKVKSAVEAIDADLDTVTEMSPVILEGSIDGDNNLQRETLARLAVIEGLGLPEDTKAIPAHEYASALTYPISVDKSTFQRLHDLKECTSFPEVALTLREMLNTGALSLRLYRFIDERLTNAINSALKYNLSIDSVTIDSFIDDISDLYVYIAKNIDDDINKVLDSRVKSILKRHLQFAEVEYREESGENNINGYCIIEEYINFQTSWTLGDINSLNLEKGKAVLITRTLHPKVCDVLQDIFTRNKDVVDTSTIRLITVDGVYIEILSGWLVDRSILMRKL